LDGSDAEQGSLRRVLGPWALTSLGVGAIIGAGIFVLTGLAAREQAGPAIILSFVVAGLGSAFCALCYAEFASMLPVAGGAYAYAYASLGEFLAWIIGWDLILEYGVGSAAVATGWAYYFLRLLETLGIQFPPFLAADPILTEGAWLNLPALVIVLILTAVLVTGIRQSAGFNAFMVAVKIAIVLFVIVVGAFFVQSANWKPFAPFGVSGIVSGAAYVFFAYIGFDAVSTHAEEALRPQRDVPIGILASLGLCTLLYMLVALVLTGMVSYREIDINAPVAAAFLNRGVNWAGLLISVGAVVGLTSVLLVILLSLARVIFAVARDGLLPKNLLGTVHPRFRTPHVATIVGGGAVSLMAAFIPLEDLARLVNIGTLMAFAIVCTSVLVLRKSQPHTPRPFRCPWVPVIPVLGIVFNLVMMLSLGWVNWVRLVGWFALGLVIYWSYGRRHSLLRQH
jgi:APA family basic amino acid/polyamine antiporter